jgi:hypothetical protein
MTLQSDVDILLVRDHAASDTAWSDQVGELATTISRWTGNDARVVEFMRDELRTAGAEPLIRDVVDHGLTVAGSRAWLIRQLKATPDKGGRR